MKQCSECKKEFKSLWKAKTRDHGAMCAVCWRKYQAQQESRSGGTKIGNVTMYSWDKYRKRKTTGELKLFMQIYSERKGVCEITGKPLKFEPSIFAHILSKAAFPSYRLNPDNIVMCDKRIHDLYDNSDRETLLRHFPEAEIIYRKKDELRFKYYNE